jgi:hypothetical protein
MQLVLKNHLWDGEKCRTVCVGSDNQRPGGPHKEATTMQLIPPGKRFRGVVSGDWYQTATICVMQKTADVFPGLARVCEHTLTSGKVKKEGSKAGEVWDSIAGPRRFGRKPVPWDDIVARNHGEYRLDPEFEEILNDELSWVG